MTGVVDRSRLEKLYVQLKETFRQKIVSGEWHENTRIPTETELCAAFGVSKITVRQALGGLVDEGLLKRVQGKGTFVVPGAAVLVQIPSLAVKTRLTDDVAGQEVPFEIQVLGARLVSGKHELFHDDEVAEITRLRVVREEPVLLERTQVATDICPGILEADLTVKSIYGALVEKSVLQIARVVKTFEMGRLTSTEADLLGGMAGQEALVVQRILSSASERTIAYTRSVTVSEKYKFQAVYERI